MKEFIAQRKRQEEKIDKNIDELLQKGKTKEAVLLMQESKRYTSAEGIKNRVERFYRPMMARWKTMNKQEKAEFYFSLSPDQQRELIGTLTLGKGLNFGKSDFMKKYGK
jgi:hypothetical protein